MRVLRVRSFDLMLFFFIWVWWVGYLLQCRWGVGVFSLSING